jgi:hypothetical protein
MKSWPKKAGAMQRRASKADSALKSTPVVIGMADAQLDLET